MRDGIYHNEGGMTPRKSAARTAKTASPSAGIRDRELSDLLAHLGRLLAQEYVALLAESRRIEPNGEETK